MLSSLQIENFTIVSKLELDFSAGMTAFTGETGAGKSILIDALTLALGGRGDASLIRPGADKCDISACFHFEKDSLPGLWLAEHELSNDENLVVLRRVINQEGRSKAFINGIAFPLQKMKELSDLLVAIHGQHQQQRLLQHVTHRQQLDQYAGHEQLLAELAECYRAYQQSERRLEQLKNQGSSQERVALLRYQLEELHSLNLQEAELQSLHEEHQLLHHAKDYLETIAAVNQLLTADENYNVGVALHQVLQRLSDFPQENSIIKNIQELINTALIQTEEAVSELSKFAEQVQLDPERLQEVEERMSLLHQMARKYHVDASLLHSHAKALQAELQGLENAEQEVHGLLIIMQEQLKAYESKAQLLRQSRIQQAEKLAAEITAGIRTLGMPQGYIQIALSPLEKMQIHGLDKVEYLVCTNPGMVPDALSKIASGGELSRISLAIEMITAEKASSPTLLFDEVDVGIGGSTAALVGQMLRKLGERLQVFCVTHQAQVAASAHHHFLVEKYTENQQTFSKIRYLDPESKIDEIARMIGGLKITEQSRSHAKELLVF